MHVPLDPSKIFVAALSALMMGIELEAKSKSINRWLAKCINDNKPRLRNTTQPLKTNMAALYYLVLNNLKDIPLCEKMVKNTMHSMLPFGYLK